MDCTETSWSRVTLPYMELIKEIFLCVCVCVCVYYILYIISFQMPELAESKSVYAIVDLVPTHGRPVVMKTDAIKGNLVTMFDVVGGKDKAFI